jgi:mevalonate kinase
MRSFSAHGKVLLTGEYLVLQGATALGLPTKLGQSLTVRHCERSKAIQVDPHQANSGWIASAKGLAMTWNAYKPDGLWFSATLNPITLETVETNDPSKAEKLINILKAVRQLNPQAIQPGLCFETHLEFDPAWGLGSSSTLISNLAQWAEVNPYELLKRTIGGSGYDIACATASTAIYYRLDNGNPLVQPLNFNPPFVDRLFFVYQGKKQHSSEEVKAFNQQWDQSALTADIQTISELSVALPTITYFEDFCTLLQVHENILSRCLGREPVQQQYPDFKGTLKSLGAWGGDFLLAATELSFDEVCEYFKNKGLSIVFKYQDLIL